MVKTKIVETTEKYDDNGKLVEKVTREETREDDTVCSPQYIPHQYRPFDTGKNWESYCTVTAHDTNNTKLL